MSSITQQTLILVAEDRNSEYRLLELAFAEGYPQITLQRVHNGVELMAYLSQCGASTAIQQVSRPDMILLDVNMPSKNGLEALAEIKANPHWRGIPVIMMTTCSRPSTVQEAYDLGASAYIVKPLSFDELERAVKTFAEYWFGIVRLPSGEATLSVEN
ncbi:MAG: response regulator [Abitibacteriaceae bacterium]|nr:response regulator [Abditibacteriaceae bacterium]MBV9864616.1 response regulator [Abditibacteriaceae bacterium]